LNQEEAFVIRHFAGDVCYDVSAFLDKNADALHSDLELLLLTTDNALIKQLFNESNIGETNKKESLGKKFVSQLGKLMESLNETTSHFIRCIKPNTAQQEHLFQGNEVMHQLACLGMFETLLLMHAGYPTRCPYGDLCDRYRDYMPPVLQKLDPQSFCEALLMAIDVPRRDFQLGITRVFFRAGRLALLDELRGGNWQELAKDIAIKVQKWLARKRLMRAFRGVFAAVKFQNRINKMRAFKQIRMAAGVMRLIAVSIIRRVKKMRRLSAAITIQTAARRYIYTKKLKRLKKVQPLLNVLFVVILPAKNMGHNSKK